MDFIFTIPLGHVSDVSIGVYHNTPVFGISSFSLNSDLLQSLDLVGSSSLECNLTGFLLLKDPIELPGDVSFTDIFEQSIWEANLIVLDWPSHHDVVDLRSPFSGWNKWHIIGHQHEIEFPFVTIFHPEFLADCDVPQVGVAHVIEVLLGDHWSLTVVWVVHDNEESFSF